MRHDLPFGRFDLPGTWTDSSTYHFLGELPQPKMGLLAAAASRQRAPMLTVTVTSGELPPNASLAALVNEQQQQLAQSFRGFQLTSSEQWAHDGGDAVPQIEFSFEAAPGVVVRQRQCYFKWGKSPKFTCLAMACHAPSYDAAKATLLQIFRSFSVEGLGV